MSSRQHAIRTAGVIAVVLVAIIGVLLLGRGVHEPSEQGMTGEKLAPEVRVVKARTDTIRSVRTLPATVEPTRVARLASPAEGPVARLLVREGDLVKSGQLLVLIGRNRTTQAKLLSGSPFFFGAVLDRLFGADGNPIWTTQTRILGYDRVSPRYTRLVGSVAASFKGLTIVVMVLLIGHILLDALARLRARKTTEKRASTVWVQRFNSHFRAQHLLLVLSVGALFLSGLFLFGTRYPGASWAANLTGALGGLDFWRVIHRLGGALLMITAGYHLIYSLIHDEGRRDFKLMLPTWMDFRHLGQNLRFFFGRSQTPPEFDRFTYFEKFDYWAVFWGCLIMIGTGLAMWFNDLVRVIFPSITTGGARERASRRVLMMR